MKRSKDIAGFVRKAPIGTRDTANVQILQKIRRAYEGAPAEECARGRSIVPRGRIARLTSVYTSLRHMPTARIAALAAAIVIGVVIYEWFSNSGGGLAFGRVLENMARVQTFHARFHQDGKEREIWAKRPNMLRWESDDETIEISNGPTMWVINKPFNKATKKPSYYFDTAQKQGLDVIDHSVQMWFADGYEALFSEGPAGRINRDGRTLDRYRMEFTDQDIEIHFEALADAQTHLLYSFVLQGHREGELVLDLGLSEISYNAFIADELFSFEPPAGMRVAVEERKEPVESAPPAEGAMLSGVITWAGNGKPVRGARVSVSGGELETLPDGTNKWRFFVTAETDRDGYWKVAGAPSGPMRIHVRSWEFEWPAVSTFTSNMGSSKDPRIIVDGRSEYTGLNFKVYKPDEHYARITANVTDEDRRPVRGVGAYLEEVETGDIHQHVYATARRHQFTQRDGKFDARDIRPTIRPVRLHVGPRDQNEPYVLRGVYTDPIMIESRKHYHFDVVLPYKRQMTVRVVDPNGQPLDGVSVSVLDREDAGPIFPLWPRMVPSDADGRAEVSGMQPGENVLIALRRLDASQPDPWNPLVCSLVPATAPLDRANPLVQVTFDDRPITIEGRLRLDSPVQSAFVRVYVTGQRGDRHLPLVRTHVDEEGGFALRGVPAGAIRLLYGATGPDKTSHTDDAMITVEPGCRYRVEFTEQGLRLLSQEPLP